MGFLRRIIAPRKNVRRRGPLSFCIGGARARSRVITPRRSYFFDVTDRRALSSARERRGDAIERRNRELRPRNRAIRLFARGLILI